MGYGLGVDLGTTHTAAAVAGDRVEAVQLGTRRAEIPSMLYLHTDGTMLVGEAAERRGDADPARLARECKRRIGDPVPIMLGGTPFSAHALTARLLQQVVAMVTRTQGAAPDRIVLTHPANWGPYKCELLRQAARLADLPAVTLRPEPEAAAVRFASTTRVAEGAGIAVYDLGGGTFDAAVLRKSATGCTVLGEPSGIEQLGGVDFDEAVLEHVRATLGDALATLEPSDADARTAMARLRRDCVAAKEALSFDTEAVISVALPRLHTRVRINRAEFAAMIRPALADTVAVLERAVRSAGVAPADLHCIVLAGGSARIPLVAEMLSAAFDRPVVLDEQPELGIAMGAALLSRPPPPTAPRPVFRPPPRQTAPPAVPPSPSPVAATVASRSPAAGPPFPGAAPCSVGPGPATARARATVRPPPATPPPPITARPARRRLWAYRWPLIGGVVAAALVVTAATAWPRSGEKSGVPAAPAAASLAPPLVTTLWETRTGHPATGPVAVAANHVVVAGADGNLRGLRRADGRQAWITEAGAGVTLATRTEAGVAHAITAAGTLLAVDAATGDVRWRRRTGGQFGARPFVAGPWIYAGGRDGILYAYEDDNRRWRVWTDAEIDQPPLRVGETAVVAGTDGRLYGVREFGAIAWKSSVGRSGQPPVAAGDAVCAAPSDRSLTCLRAADGQRRITLPAAGLSLPAGGVDGVVYAAAADGTLGAWDSATGTARWRHPPGAQRRIAALSVHGGHVLVAYADGRLIALDTATGRERWQHAVTDTLETAPTGEGRSLFVVGRTGTVHALTVPFAAGPAPVRTAPATATTRPTAITEPTTRPTRRRTVEPPRTRPTTSPTSFRPPPTTEPPEPTTVPPTTPPPSNR